MDTTARRALSELIDQLCAPVATDPSVEVPPTLAGLLDPAAGTTSAAPAEPKGEPPAPVAPVAEAALVLVPPQPGPGVVPAARTVLPDGARSAILWRSR